MCAVLISLMAKLASLHFVRRLAERTLGDWAESSGGASGVIRRKPSFRAEAAGRSRGIAIVPTERPLYREA